MRENIQILLLSIISFFAGTSHFVIAGILDKIAESLNISIASAGQLITFYSLSSAIGTPFLIMLFSKYNQKKQMILLLSIFLVGMFLTPFAKSFEFLILTRIIIGVSTTSFITIAYSFVSKIAPQGKQGSAMANIALGFSLALILGVPLGRYLTAFFQWQMIFWLIGALVAGLTIILAITIPPLKANEVMGLKKQLHILKDVKVVLSLGVSFLVFIMFSAISTFITPFLQTFQQSNKHDIEMILLLFGVASLIGSKLGPVLADKIGINPVLLASQILSLLSLLVIFFDINSYGVVIVFLSIWTFSTWIFGPTQIFNLATLKKEATNILLGLNSSAIHFGFAFGGAIGGVIVSYFGIKDILYLGVIFAILALGVNVVFIKKHINSP